MTDIVKDYFKQFDFLAPQDFDIITSIAEIKLISKGEYLLTSGELSYEVFYIINGLFRHYVIDENGVDKTLRFTNEKQNMLCSETIFHGNPSMENIIALENSIVIKIDEREIDKYNSNEQLLKLKIQSLKQVIIGIVEHIKLLALYSPETRYEFFCKTYPNLEQRIKQKYLASYLAITPTSLSRLRSRILKNNRYEKG